MLCGAEQSRDDSLWLHHYKLKYSLYTFNIKKLISAAVMSEITHGFLRLEDEGKV